MLECIFIYIIFLLHVTLSRLSRSKPKSPTDVCYRNTLKNAWHCVTAWHRTLPVKQPNHKSIFIYYFSNTYFIPILILFKYLFYSNTYLLFYSNTKSWWVWWIHVWIVDEGWKKWKKSCPPFHKLFKFTPLCETLSFLGQDFFHFFHFSSLLYRIYYSIPSLLK